MLQAITTGRSQPLPSQSNLHLCLHQRNELSKRTFPRYTLSERAESVAAADGALAVTAVATAAATAAAATAAVTAAVTAAAEHAESGGEAEAAAEAVMDSSKAAMSVAAAEWVLPLLTCALLTCAAW